MNDYNPQENFYFYGGTDGAEVKRTFIGCMSTGFFVALFIVVFALLALNSCTTTRVVKVPEVHEVIHHQSDTVIQKDSVIHEKETVIMKLDSATMAQYGIQLKATERAWLVSTKKLEKELQRIAKIKTDTLTIRDSIPYPVEVTKEVQAKISRWQRLKMNIGLIFIGSIIVIIAAIFFRKRILP